PRPRARHGRGGGISLLEAALHRHPQRVPSQELVRGSGPVSKSRGKVNGAHPDIIVLGAGIVGAGTAYFLARKGVRVLVIEGEAPPWGASGRNPGFQWLHTRKAGIHMELGLAGRRLADQLREELDDFEMRPSGGMIYFTDERQLPLFRAFVAERREAGLPMELIDGKVAREHCPYCRRRCWGRAGTLSMRIRTRPSWSRR